MADIPTCITCRRLIPRRKSAKGYDKRSLTCRLRGQGINLLEAMQRIYPYEGPTTGYVCTHCYLQVEKDFRKYQRMRTCMYTLEEPEEEQRNHEIDIPDKSPKIPKKVFSSPATPKSHKRGRKRKRVTKTKKQERHLSEQSKFFPICNALMHSNYYSALRSIFRSCPSSKRAFADIVRTEVVREMRAFAKVDNPSAGSITGIESIKTFSWMDLIGQAAKKMPIFHAAVCGAMGMKKSTEHKRKGRGHIEPRIGLMLSIPMYSINPWRYKMVQSLCSLLLWQHGGQAKLYRSLNRLGVCQSIATTRRLVDLLSKESDKEMQECIDAFESENPDSAEDVPELDLIQTSDVDSTAIGTMDMDSISAESDCESLCLLEDMDHARPTNTACSSLDVSERNLSNIDRQPSWPEEMKKVLITGASGLLGRAVFKEFSARSDWSTLGLAYSRVSDKLSKVDLTDAAAVEKTIAEFKPSVIIHSAAKRRPDEVEKQEELTHALNVDATSTICVNAAKIGAPVIYISTDYVFDGKSPPYGVDAPTNPINKYGISKLAGEKAVMDINEGNVILRVPVLYGEIEDINESAVTCLFTTVMNTNETRSMSDYEIKYPTHVGDVASVLRELCDRKLETPSLSGAFHWSGDERLTKYEQACIMAEVFGLPTSHMIPDKKPSAGAPRPYDTQLDISRLEELGISHHRKFKDHIRAVIAPHYKG